MSEELEVGQGVDVVQYGRVLWRRKWLVAAVVAVFAAAAALFGGDGAVAAYTSKAQVLVKPITANPFDRPARVDQAVDLETEGEILSSVAVAELVRAKLGTSEDAAALADRVATAPLPETQVLAVSYRAPTAAAARAGAQSFAEAYLEYKTNETLAAVAKVTDGLGARIADLEGQLRQANGVLATNPVGSAPYAAAEASREVVTSQIALLRNQVASYAGVDVDPGSIIRPGAEAEPVRSGNVPAPLAGAAGLLVGVAAAFVRDRFDDRLHAAGEISESLQLPLLAAVPRRRRRRRHRELALDPLAPEAEAYQRLAANLVALARVDNARSVLVTSASMNEGKSTVAANLALALARCGRRVALVSADLRLPTLGEFFPLPSGPTVNDLLAGEATDAEVARAVAGWPNLVVYPSAATAAPGELLHPPALAGFLDRLSAAYDLVVVDAPPVLPVADTLAFAPKADAALLVVRQGTTTRADAVRARDHLVQVGARLAGAAATHAPRTRAAESYYLAPKPGRSGRRRLPRRPGDLVQDMRSALEELDSGVGTA